MSARKTPDMPGLTRDYAQRLMAEVAEWRTPGSSLQRREVLLFLRENGEAQIGRVAVETGMPPASIRAAVPELVRRVKTKRGAWREVVSNE